jgi:hypothetical protein
VSRSHSARQAPEGPSFKRVATVSGGELSSNGTGIASSQTPKISRSRGSSRSRKDHTRDHGKSDSDVSGSVTVKLGQGIDKVKENDFKSDSPQIVTGPSGSTLGPAAGQFGFAAQMQLSTAIRDSSSLAEDSDNTLVRSVGSARDSARDKKWEVKLEEMKQNYESRLELLQKKASGSDERFAMLEEGLKLLKTVCCSSLPPDFLPSNFLRELKI